MANIDPKVDIAFKKIFGVEENKDLLISLVNSIVSVEDQVASLTLLNPYNVKSFQDDKLSILDIKAQGAEGKMFNIEIQVADESDYSKRALYYWAKLYIEQLRSGSSYAKLEKTIGIHILNFTSIPEAIKYHNAFHITEKETGLPHFQELELHTIELSKFSQNPKEGLASTLSKVQNALDIWAAFLTKHELLVANQLPRELDNPNLQKALTVLEVMSFTEEERRVYEDRLSWLRFEASALKKSEEKGHAQGLEQGREEGIKIGETKGREEGEISGKIEVARKLLARGYSPPEVAQVTGLNQEELKKL